MVLPIEYRTYNCIKCIDFQRKFIKYIIIIVIIINHYNVSYWLTNKNILCCGDSSELKPEPQASITSGLMVSTISYEGFYHMISFLLYLQRPICKIFIISH